MVVNSLEKGLNSDSKTVNYFPVLVTCDPCAPNLDGWKTTLYERLHTYRRTKFLIATLKHLGYHTKKQHIYLFLNAIIKVFYINILSEEAFDTIIFRFFAFKRFY